MPEEESRKKPRDPDLEIAAADWLIQDDTRAKSNAQSQNPVTPTDAESGETFALADGPSSAVEEAPAPVAVPALPRQESISEAASRPRRERKSARTTDQSTLDPSALVEEVWSRKSEWGLNLLAVFGWLAAVFAVAYLAAGAEAYGLAVASFLLGLLVAVVMCYPIFITLERPVRITPEQAVRDYYGALSHHLPHFRRMWLLLSSAGRISTAYGSFEGFKSYWKSRLETLRAGHAGGFTPLVFEVADFKADKSAGKIMIDAEYTLKVWVRGQRKKGAIHVIPMKIMLVRGPDKMWYLENGTLGRDAS